MRYRKNFILAATIGIFIVCTPAHAKPALKLDTVNHRAYITGANGSFFPDQELSRAEAAVLFSRLLVDENENPAYAENDSYSLPFSDLAEKDWFASYVGFMNQQNLLEGYSDGTFRPGKGITRAEYTALLFRLTQTESGAIDFELPFSDVSSDHWAKKAIFSAVHSGYINGYPDDTFRPENPITRAEAVTVLNRALGRCADKTFIQNRKDNQIFRDLSLSHWAYYEIFEAAASHHYEQQGETETWLDAWDIPKNPYAFVSDTFSFLLPELKTNGSLVPLDFSKIDSIALHHMDHPTAGFREIEDWHLQRGFDAIGYNFWIDFEGNISVGRGWNRGAGVANQNGHIISIGFQGDYEKKNTSMPQAQYQAGVQLIRWIQQKIPSAVNIGGHGDFAATDCPGKYFPLQQMKEEAQK